MANENVIVVSFPVEANAYQGLSTLKQVAATGQIKLVNGVVIKRAEDGSYSIEDLENRTIGNKTGTGGLIGALVGILGGPLGVLFGWGAGALIGSAAEVDDAIESEAMLSQLSTLIAPGTTGLVAEVDEDSTSVIDGEMTKLNGTVHRRSVQEIQDEIESAQEAQKAAEKEARRVLREKNRSERREKVEGWVDNIKERITGND